MSAAGIRMVGPPSSPVSQPGRPLLSSAHRAPASSFPPRSLSVVIGAAIFVAAFLYVLPEATELVDDHYMHVAWGRQLLYGRWFVRDMAALGLPLQSAVSAASEWMVGYRLLSEGLIISLAFATGGVLTYVLARRASGSLWVGALAATFQVAVSPRTYGYPKIVLYAAAILAFWRYIERPSRGRLALIGAIVAIGFYLRHDHGLYLGLLAGAVLALRHVREWSLGMRRLAALAAVCALTMGPYLVYTHLNGGVLSYLTDLRDIAERERQQNHFDAWPQWPLSSVDDLVQWPADPPNATIGIRWSASAPEDARRAAAARYGLHVEADQPVESGRFLLTDISAGNILALMRDPVIDDTSGVDRGTGVVPLQGLRIGALHLMSGLDAPAASAAFLFYAIIAILPITLIEVWRRRQELLTIPPEHATIVAVVLVGIVTAIGFLREPLTIRIADAVVAPLVLAAWWIGRWVRGPVPAGARWRRILPAMIAVGLLVPITRSVVVIGAVPTRAERLLHLPETWRQLTVSPPFEGWKATGSAKYQAVRYVRACTAPDDPLLVLWFAPDLYYYSGRPFAGRLGFYMEGYWTSANHERTNVAAIEHDGPTIVLMEPGRTATDLYTYPLLLDYLSTIYQRIGVVESSDGRQVEIHARSDRAPSGVDPDTGWPCFAGGAEIAPSGTVAADGD